jgi:SAM-dependent methyltransferase
MLAERVGATGTVLAVDLDTSLLEPLASDRVEVRQHDLLSDPLPQDAFDLVHARLLLMFFPSRLQALRRLAAAVRPGGWIAVLEPDFGTVALSPANRSWERVWSAFCDAAVAGGWDPRYGARLCGDLGAAGLVEVEAQYFARCGPGASLGARLFSMTLERMRGRMVALGAASDEIDEARALLEDPASTYRGPTTCVARGRRAG